MHVAIGLTEAHCRRKNLICPKNMSYSKSLQFQKTSIPSLWKDIGYSKGLEATKAKYFKGTYMQKLNWNFRGSLGGQTTKKTSLSGIWTLPGTAEHTTNFSQWLLSTKELNTSSWSFSLSVLKVSTYRRCDWIELQTTLTVTFLPSSDVLERQAFLDVWYSRYTRYLGVDWRW